MVEVLAALVATHMSSRTNRRGISRSWWRPLCTSPCTLSRHIYMKFEVTSSDDIAEHSVCDWACTWFQVLMSWISFPLFSMSLYPDICLISMQDISLWLYHIILMLSYKCLLIVEWKTLYGSWKPCFAMFMLRLSHAAPEVTVSSKQSWKAFNVWEL